MTEKAEVYAPVRRFLQSVDILLQTPSEAFVYTLAVGSLRAEVHR